MICPACAQAPLSPLADLGVLPAECGATFATAHEAQASARGRMRLEACGVCGHVANTAFDPALAHFDASFEAALFHSPTYSAYALGVVDRLVKGYDLEGKRVLELASGSPVLLDRLNSWGCLPEGVPDASVSGADFIIARFVFEHQAEPCAVLEGMRAHASHAFIEVPDAGYDLTTAGWDCIYPHAGYFGAESLRAILGRAGWRVLELGTAFNEQYLWAEVVAGDSNVDTFDPTVFRPDFEAADIRWCDEVRAARAVVWGAGTRGTMFCNRVDPDGGSILGVVDRNPAKHGRFLPLAGHPVLAPADLAALRPDTVILTNPAYRDEIAAELAGMGISPRLLVA